VGWTVAAGWGFGLGDSRHELRFYSVLDLVVCGGQEGEEELWASFVEYIWILILMSCYDSRTVHAAISSQAEQGRRGGR